MPSLETLSAFFLASTLLALAPGPDNIFVLTQSALYGKTSGLAVMFGLCTGLIIHTTAVALGIAVIFQASALAFTILKVIGALYLIYLARQIIFSPPQKVEMTCEKRLQLPSLYRRGIIMNVTNPKVSVFFLAFLPQFADPSKGTMSIQMIVLGLIFIVATILVFGSVAIVGGVLGRWLNQSERFQRYLNWSAGAIFLALALKLVTSER
jgi:threonine/homoserine/homoserine lactone efflux protein